MPKVLVTGGLGFIGSHTSVELLERGFDVVLVDNLCNSEQWILERIVELAGDKGGIDYLALDMANPMDVKSLFEAHPNIDGVIHFAAHKSVGESVNNPLKYYQNNLGSLVCLLQEMTERGLDNIIFSSSCTVYGEAEELPITETAPVQLPMSPYGNTKQIGEEIIFDTTEAHTLNAIALRYFNPVGAHDTHRIGELPIGVPLYLVPYITQTAAGLRDELLVFGDDYPTRDGTCIRDYIHVMDIAEAHVIALERLFKKKNETAFEIFNLGTGTGSTVLEVIQSFEKVSGEKLNFRIVEKRPGDVVAAYADTEKADKVLGWKAHRSLDQAMLSAWLWEKDVRGIK